MMNESNIVKIRVKVIPNAKRTQITGWLEKEILTIRVAEIPVTGKANQALIAVLAKKLGVNQADVLIKSGQSGRMKTVWLVGMEENLVRERITKSID